MNTTNHYQVGGSLNTNATCYVVRQADQELLEHLQKGDFCYILNSRQMGKSSLLVRTRKILQEQGWQTASIDMTLLGSTDVTMEQWYLGIMSKIYKDLHLGKIINLLTWYKSQPDISLVQIFNQFIEEILFTHLPEQNIVIFVDEIDSILSLNFSVDDFFTLIRLCYNERATNSAYQRLTFALFGVATPTDLIKDKKRTPFNIGHAINLNGFTLIESQPLIEGFPAIVIQPQILLREILYWTAGQPFLTQKVCQLVIDSLTDQDHLLDEKNITEWLQNLIQNQIINYWESNDEPEHLRTIRDRLNYNEQRKGSLLGLYHKILEGKENVLIDNSEEQTELILSGLVVKHENYLRVKNPIYAHIFNQAWVTNQLNLLCPYSQALIAWIDSQQQDESRLLRGQALQDAQLWSQGKSLSALDYKFLARSYEIDRQEIQQKLETEKAKVIQVQLIEEQKRLSEARKNSKLQKIFLSLLSFAFVVSSLLGLMIFYQYRQARIAEIKALTLSAQGLFNSHRQLEAMVVAIEAKYKLNNLAINHQKMVTNTANALNQTIYGTNEFNRLIGHKGSITGLAISNDDQLILTSSSDSTTKLWQRDGKLLQTLKHPKGYVRSVAFSADDQFILTSSMDGLIKVWRLNGTLVRNIIAHNASIWDMKISPDGQLIATASSDRTIKLWTIDGKLHKTLTGHQGLVWSVDFSPDSQMIASTSNDNTVKLWNINNGELIKTLTGHSQMVWDVSFCSNDILVSGSADNKAYIWQTDGQLINVLENNHAIMTTACRGEYIATGSTDNIVRIWKKDGTLVNLLRQHDGIIYNVIFNQNGTVLASSSDDGTVKLWRPHQEFFQTIYAYKERIWDLATSPNNQLFATVNVGNGLKLWHIDGKNITINTANLTTDNQFLDNQNFSTTFSPDSKILITGNMKGLIKLWQVGETAKSPLKLLKILSGHKSNVLALVVSNDQKILASAGDDRSIKLWDMQGKLLKTIDAHQELIWRLVFTPDSQYLLSASLDRTVKIWNREGKLVNILQHPSSVWGLALQPQKNRIITASRDDTLNFWSFDGKLEKTITTNSRGLARVVVSPDGKMIATAGIDGNIKLWDADGQLLAVLPSNQGSILSLAFTADSQSIISGSANGILIIWDLAKILQLNNLEYACNWVKDYLQNSDELSDSQRNLCNDTLN
jgi:WD40 repeat protein